MATSIRDPSPGEEWEVLEADKARGHGGLEESSVLVEAREGQAKGPESVGEGDDGDDAWEEVRREA